MRRGDDARGGLSESVAAAAAAAPSRGPATPARGRRYLGARELGLGVELNLDELAEARGVVVAHGAGVAKGLEDGVRLHHLPGHNTHARAHAHSYETPPQAPLVGERHIGNSMWNRGGFALPPLSTCLALQRLGRHLNQTIILTLPPLPTCLALQRLGRLLGRPSLEGGRRRPTRRARARGLRPGAAPAEALGAALLERAPRLGRARHRGCGQATVRCEGGRGGGGGAADAAARHGQGGWVPRRHTHRGRS